MGQAQQRKQLLGDAYGKPPEIVWHYTLAMKVAPISVEGLRSVFRKDGLVWFTQSQNIDPTSAVAITRNDYTSSLGDFAFAVLDESMSPGRVGVKASLTEWYPDALKKQPRLSDFTAFLRGANPRQWHVSGELGAVQIDRYQRWTGASWVEATPAEAPAGRPGGHIDANATIEDQRKVALQQMRETGQDLMVLPSGQVVFRAGFFDENPEFVATLRKLHQKAGKPISGELLKADGNSERFSCV